MITRVDLHDSPLPYFEIYIGRANVYRNLPQSKWANPFKMKNEGHRQEVIDKYREYILGKPELLACLPELKDKVLGCWCPPHKKCHGDILIELYNQFVGDDNDS